MKKILTLCLAIVLHLATSGQEENWERAIEHYNNKNYDKAIEQFKAIEKQGLYSGELYYNIANAYYKKADVANSIYYYEKALRLLPKDQDVIGNLKYAQRMRIDKITPLPKLWVEKTWNKICGAYSSDGWAKLVVFFWAAFVGLFVAYKINKKDVLKRTYFWTCLLSLCLSLTSMAFANKASKAEKDQSYAIVFDDEVQVRTEPNPYSSNAFTIHAGTKIRVEEGLKNWVKINLENGNKGWIEKQSIKVIKNK